MNSVARINREHLKNNFQSICAVAGPESTVLPVIKRNGYGHGAVKIARILIDAGAQRFAVASTAEANVIRKAGITEELIILCGLQPGEEADAAAIGVTPMVHTIEQLIRWQAQAKLTSRILPYHLEIDSGMARLGSDISHIDKLIDAIKMSDKTKLVGIATHLASAQDFTSDQTEQQVQLFKSAVQTLAQAGIAPHLLHIANTAALAYRPALALDMVRPGLGLYGYVDRSQGIAPTSQLQVQPILEWYSSILSIRDIPADTLIGYNGTYRSPEDMRVGVVGVGYGDGFDYRLSNSGQIFVGDRICPVIGSVNMDVTLIDLRPAPRATPGDEVTLIGKNCTAQDLAEQCNTIVYEVLCNISSRVPREYV
jgi:alanine racemase